MSKEPAPAHRFEVWAPRAEQVEVVIEGTRWPLAPATRRGWHEGVVAGAGPGARYAFSLDGGPPRPDPRSASQPEGVDGPSELIDHGMFRWSDAGWRGIPLASAVVYELHVGTFTEEGTFDAVVDKLDHLVDLGVDAVELLPVNEFPGERGWGYDGVALFAPHHAYGGPDGLKRLVDACHGAGLAVILDVVYNHLGPAGNYLGEYGPYFTDKYSTPWGMAVNLDDRGSDETRRFLLDNALGWLRDYHFDGLRIDAVHALVDRSAMHLLEEMAVEVEALEAELGRSLFLIAESDLNDPRVVARREVGGYGMDAQWSDDFHHALHAALTGEHDGYYADFGGLGDVATALQRVFVHAGHYSPHRGRRHGRAPDGIPGWRFLGYLQNHDQVGNRAQGDRSSHLLSPQRLKIAAVLVFTAPFVPMLFMGEEWGAGSPFQYFTDHQDPDLGRAVSQGRRSEFSSFGWSTEEVPDPQDPDTFWRSKLDWSERDIDPHAELLAWHKALIRLRRGYPELTSGSLAGVEVDVDEAAGHLQVRRGRVRVVVNLGVQPWDLPQEPTKILLESRMVTTEAATVVTLATDGVVIFT
ncbi:MAG: malto-oligosyltrehalose trehalohydrolase [Actinobacteria bacterium]|nr:malto-oligosyltrehalose trehalohydrolase [Actinomycetota bacterium]MBW3649401.1 malto-oligosyltrehalose trehalohydrolase [Actinomycetota bacterium]